MTNTLKDDVGEALGGLLASVEKLVEVTRELSFVEKRAAVRDQVIADLAVYRWAAERLHEVAKVDALFADPEEAEQPKLAPVMEELRQAIANTDRAWSDTMPAVMLPQRESFSGVVNELVARAAKAGLGR